MKRGYTQNGLIRGVYTTEKYSFSIKEEDISKCEFGIATKEGSDEVYKVIAKEGLALIYKISTTGRTANYDIVKISEPQEWKIDFKSVKEKKIMEELFNFNDQNSINIDLYKKEIESVTSFCNDDYEGIIFTIGGIRFLPQPSSDSMVTCKIISEDIFNSLPNKTTVEINGKIGNMHYSYEAIIKPKEVKFKAQNNVTLNKNELVKSLQKEENNILKIFYVLKDGKILEITRPQDEMLSVLIAYKYIDNIPEGTTVLFEKYVAPKLGGISDVVNNMNFLNAGISVIR